MPRDFEFPNESGDDRPDPDQGGAEESGAEEGFVEHSPGEAQNGLTERINGNSEEVPYDDEGLEPDTVSEGQTDSSSDTVAEDEAHEAAEDSDPGIVVEHRIVDGRQVTGVLRRPEATPEEVAAALQGCDVVIFENTNLKGTVKRYELEHGATRLLSSHTEPEERNSLEGKVLENNLDIGLTLQHLVGTDKQVSFIGANPHALEAYNQRASKFLEERYRRAIDEYMPVLYVGSMAENYVEGAAIWGDTYEDMLREQVKGRLRWESDAIVGVVVDGRHHRVVTELGNRSEPTDKPSVDEALEATADLEEQAVNEHRRGDHERSGLATRGMILSAWLERATDAGEDASRLVKKMDPMHVEYLLDQLDQLFQTMSDQSSWRRGVMAGDLLGTVLEGMRMADDE